MPKGYGQQLLLHYIKHEVLSANYAELNYLYLHMKPSPHSTVRSGDRKHLF